MNKKEMKIKEKANAEMEEFLHPDKNKHIRLSAEERRRKAAREREEALTANDSMRSYEERHLSED